MAWAVPTNWTTGDTIDEAKLDAVTAAITELQGQFTTVTGVSVTPTNPLVAHTQEEKEVTVTGAAVTKACLAIPPVNLEAGVTYQAYCSDTDKVKVRLSNVTASDVATAAKNWSFILVEPNP